MTRDHYSEVPLKPDTAADPFTTRRAIVIGATGAVGSALVGELLAPGGWAAVTTLVRRRTRLFDHTAEISRLTEHVVNMADTGALERQTAALARDHDAAFCTMGIGQPRRASKDEVWRVDVELAGAFARGCRTAGVPHISLLSSVGADADSRTYYVRVKGRAERAFTDLSFPRTSLFRPSLLVTRQLRYGLQDRITQAVVPWLSPLLPSRFHQITVEHLARAMRVNAERPSDRSVEILYYAQFMELTGSHRVG
jgi:uncharacterized protein YbjT (DUF2867 family)